MIPVSTAQRAAMAATTSATFETAAIRRRFLLVEDDYGNETRDPANAVDVPVDVALWQESGTETTADRDQQVSEWIARFPVGFDVTGRDLLVVDDGEPTERVFEVVGPPLDARTHVRARLRHVSG